MGNQSNLPGVNADILSEKQEKSIKTEAQVNLELELEVAEEEFCKAAEAKDFQAMIVSHKRLCQAVARLSMIWLGKEKPEVFVKYFISSDKSLETTSQLPRAGLQSSSLSSSLSDKTIESTDSLNAMPTVAELEKEIALLAQQMQKCLEIGDMDGMLKANEKMGSLSELMAQAESKEKDKNKAKEIDAQSNNKASTSPSSAPKQSSWAAGDTMALAKQRAEERKKQQKLADSFDAVENEDAKDKQTETASNSCTGSETNNVVQENAAKLFNPKIAQSLSQSAQQGKISGQKRKLTQEELREKLENYNFYEMLSIPTTASFELIHKSFFKKIRKINQKLYANKIEDWQFQEFVAALCLAHDILRVPNVRLQYDLVLLGTPEGPGLDAAKSKLMPLKDLIKFSTLISTKDLTQAISACEGKPEREIGYYLVEKDLLSSEELDSILFAQKLVSAGKLTVAQFELAMQELRESSIPLLDTLVASEWIRPQDVFSMDFA